MHSIVSLALPGVVTFDLSVPFEVFGNEQIAHLYRYSVCTVTPGAVRTSSDLNIWVDQDLCAMLTADTVIVPGFAPLVDPPAEAILALRAAAARGTRIVSLCTGAFALAASGLLDGRRATTHWQRAAQLAKQFPLVDVDAAVLYVEGPDICTSAGIAASIDLCIQLIRTDYGVDAAAKVARRMVVAPHRSGGQAQFIEQPVPISAHGGLTRTCDWALERLGDRITVTMMAEHAGWAPSTFARRFVLETGMTPLRWLTAQRLAESRRLLETTNLTIEAIARLCGLGTMANFRLHFARALGTTPTSYRQSFRGCEDTNSVLGKKQNATSWVA